MAERDDPGIADDEIERQRIEDVDEDARAERQILRQQEEAGEGGDPRQKLGPADARIGAVTTLVPHTCFPNSPPGRHSRTAMVAA